MQDYSEKRDFRRMTVETAITLIAMDSAQEWHGTCLDLSATGMLVNVGYAIPLETELRTRMAGGTPDAKPLETQARVIRHLERDGHILLGLETLKML
ncbi:MAG: PilZ domain-containing protein [Gammaproteobacteria bacterium]|nr:PilZ domain-containing protein [Gammaproteobacteria bacterium]